MPHILFETPLEMDIDAGMDPEPYRPPWAEVDAILKKAEADGYTIRSIVVEKKLGQYQQPDPLNWGVILRLDRYQANGAEFKPVVCQFFKRANNKPEYFSPDELLVIYPGKTWDEVITILKKGN